MQLHTLDWIIAFFAVAICFVPALFFGKRSGKSTTEFFASGRSVPWWLAGLSMVATTFSSDTPNLVANFVRTQGVAGNWQWWAFTLTGLSTVFFYARLWRRSGVLTDLEFYELRYSGKSATAVRGFRAVYLGLLFNCMIMATVNLAACKIAAILFGMERWQTLLAVGLLNVIFAAHSGLWGVLVIDMIQFFIKMAAVIGAAYFAVELPQVGGLSGLVSKLSTRPGPGGLHYLNMLPDFRNNWELAVAVFIMPVAVQWWAVWYPGAEPGGGSYVAQRMLASKSEKDSLGGTLFFNLAHYVLRPWPWILTALCSIIIFPELKDIQAAFPGADPRLIGHDSAFPAMLKFLPPGFVGLMVGGLLAANSSTILTHLNWGSSYLVHDMYRRFIATDKPEKHYVGVGRACTVGLYVLAALLSTILASAQEAFEVLISIGAGTGLLYLLRWFWWRINAWCEVVAMVSSFSVSVVFFIMKKNGHELPFAHTVLYSVAFTTLAWLITAYVSPPTSRERLIAFYKKVHPSGPGWARVRRDGAVSDAEAAQYSDDMGKATLGWISGCLTIWASLFAIGNFLYGSTGPALMLTAIFVVSGLVLLYVTNTLWDREPVTPHAAPR